MDGYTVAAELRKQMMPAPSAIIAVTGFGARQTADGEPDKIFDYYLLKPVDPERIVRLLSAGFQA
jgi:CheY-like chemotaxis protein